MLARIEFAKLLRESKLEGLFIGTVHDSLVVDSPTKNVYNISLLLKQAVESVPDLCRQHFDYDFSLPLNCEIQVGANKRHMQDVVFN